MFGREQKGHCCSLDVLHIHPHGDGLAYLLGSSFLILLSHHNNISESFQFLLYVIRLPARYIIIIVRRIKISSMSFLFHIGDLLLDGKEPVDDSVDKIVRAAYDDNAIFM